MCVVCDHKTTLINSNYTDELTAQLHNSDPNQEGLSSVDSGNNGLAYDAQTGVNALDSGVDWVLYDQWTDGVWQANGKLVITYSFEATTQNQNNSGEGASSIIAFNAAQRASAEAAMAHYEEVIDVDFQVAGTANNAAIKYWDAELPSGIAGWAWYPHPSGSDLVIDNAYRSGFDPGGFGNRLMLHELGHSMGLSHPNGSGTAAGFSSDTTVMSYNSGTYSSRVYPDAPHGLQIYDIAALQSMYGANTDFNSGNTTYSFDGSYYVKTIWDGGGTDTYDTTAYSGNTTIDLREGETNISFIGNTHIWNAFGVNIENATTGSGNDSLTGNSLANALNAGSGNDTLVGGTGNDTLTGGSGDDQYSFSTGDGHDTIIDSDSGDRITINGTTLTGEASFSSGSSFTLGTFTLTESGNDVVISLSGNNNDSWTLSNFSDGAFGITLEAVGENLVGTDSALNGNYILSTVDPNRFELVDLDGNGDLEMLTQADTFGHGLVYMEYGVGWQRVLFQNIGEYQVYDYDNDGAMEYISTNGTYGQGLVLYENGGSVSRLIYQDVGEYQVADWNNDNTHEVFSSDGTYGQGIVRYDGTLSPTITRIVFDDVGVWTVADADGDGVDEILASGGTRGAGIAMYEMNGSVTQLSEYGNMLDYTVIDFDGNGSTDIVTRDAGGVRVYDGTTSNSTLLTAAPMTHIEVADWNDDGVLDIVASLTDGIYLYEQAVGSWAKLSNEVITGEFELVDINNDNRLEIIGEVSNTVRMFRETGGNEQLRGTDNDDTINGLGGNDYLIGGTGADVFIFESRFDHDQIHDFTRGDDLLRFDGVTGITSESQVLSNVEISGGNTVITLTGHGSVTLVGYTGTLDGSDIEVI